MELLRSRGASVAILLVLCFSVLLLDLVAAADTPAPKVKSSEIIPTAGVANLANGNGDVSPSGLNLALQLLFPPPGP